MGDDCDWVGNPFKIHVDCSYVRFGCVRVFCFSSLSCQTVLFNLPYCHHCVLLATGRYVISEKIIEIQRIVLWMEGRPSTVETVE
jgi:hypothetical protein